MKDLDRHIETALKKEIDFRLPENFSDRIVQTVMARVRRERKLELAGIVTAGVLFIAALIVTFMLTEFKISLGSASFISKYFGLISFGIVFIVLLNLLDRKFIRHQQTAD